MDPWQASVEKRLDSLDRRTTSIEQGVSDIRVNVATLSTAVSALPSKEFTVKILLGGLAAMTGLVALATNLSKLLGH